MSGPFFDNIDSDIFDSRQVIDRLAELDAIDDPDEFETAERDALRAFADEMAESGPADWRYGETFISEHHFEDYARELAEGCFALIGNPFVLTDIGAISSDAQWPLSFIDWPAAARALQMDYSEVDIEGTTYYHRS